MRLAAACPKHLRAGAVLALALLFVVSAAPGNGAGGPQLVGSTTIYTNRDSNPPGVAEAFKTTAIKSGNVSDIRVYVDSGSSAKYVTAGLYAASGGHPGALLASGTLSSPSAASWNTVTFSAPVSVTSGTTYWIALLGPSGILRFRDSRGTGTSETALGSLSSLPSSWKTDRTYADGPLSAYGEALEIDATAPSTPAGLTVSSATRTSLKLGWASSSDNVGVTGYTVYLNGWEQGTVATPGYTFSGLTCGTSYTLAVDAYDDAGNVSGKSSATGTTAACSGDTTAPSTPAGLAVSGATTSSLMLKWNASTDNVGVTGYTVYLNGWEQATVTTPSYGYTGLSCGTSYTLAVEAYDDAGNVSAKGSATGTTAPCADATAPSTPTGLAVSGTSSSGLTLKWNASTDNVGVTGYTVYLNGAKQTTVTTPGYTFTGLTCGTSYTLAVDARDAAGNTSARGSTTASTSACTGDTAAPAAPTGLTVSGQTQTGLKLGWNASTDNVGVTGYTVYLNGAKQTTVTTPGYTFTGLACGTSYTLAVDAYDAAGNTSARGSTTGSTGACAQTLPPAAGSGGGVVAANIWVAPGGGACTRTDSPSAYTASLACGSLDAANDICRGGDVVGVKGGTYGTQNISGSGSGRSATSVCTIANAQDEVATFGTSVESIDIGVGSATSYLTLDGSYGAPCLDASCMRLKTAMFSAGGYPYQGRIDTERGESGIVINHVDSGMVADGASGTAIEHSDLGPSVDPYNNRQNSNGTVWQDNYIHDGKRIDGGHYECMTFDGGQNVTIQRNIFKNCEVYGIFMKPVTSAVSATIANNVFWNPAHWSTVDLDITDDGSPGNITCSVTVTGNSFSNGFQNMCPGIAAGSNATAGQDTQPADPRRLG